MTTETTYEELYNVYGVCNHVINDLKQKKLRAHGMFLNFLLTNKERTFKLLEEFEKDRPEPSEQVKEYYTKSGELRTSLARVEGETDEMWAVRKEEVDAKETALKAEYEVQLKEWEGQQAEFEAKLANKTKFNSMKLKQAYLPPDMEAEAMEILNKYIITV